MSAEFIRTETIQLTGVIGFTQGFNSLITSIGILIQEEYRAAIRERLALERQLEAMKPKPKNPFSKHEPWLKKKKGRK